MKLEVAIDEADVGAGQAGPEGELHRRRLPRPDLPGDDHARRSRLEPDGQLGDRRRPTTTTSTTGQVVSYAADLTVANPTLQLRPGMTATADIVTTDKRNVLLVPNAALRFKPTAATRRRGSGGIAGSLTFRPRRGGGAGAHRDASAAARTQTVYVKGADGKPQAGPDHHRRHQRHR